MSLTVTEMVARLGLDIDEGEFNKGDKRIEALKGAFAVVSGVVAGAATAIGVMVSQLVEAGSTADDASKTTGVSAQALTELGHAAQLSGSNAEEMRESLTHLSRTVAAAAGGSEEAGAGFAKLGVAIRDGQGHVKSADALLLEVADKFKGLPDGIEKSGLAMDVFGRSGARLIPLLDEGRGGIERLRQEARDLGIVLDAETVQAAADLGDSFDRAKASIRGLSYVIASPLLGPIRRAVDGLVAWWKANQQIIRQRVDAFWARTVPVLEAVATVLGAIGQLLLWTTEHWRGLAVVLGGVVLGALWANAGALIWNAGLYAIVAVQAIAAAVATAAAWIAATLPFIFFGALLLLLIDDIYEFATGGESFIGDFVYAVTELFTLLKETVLGVFSDVGDALMGNFDAIRKRISDIVDFAIENLGTITKLAAPLLGPLGFIANGIADVARTGVGASFGGGASPAASTALQQNTSSRSTQVSAPVDIKVFAAPGQSPGEVGRAVGSELHDSLERVLSETAATAGA